MSSSARSSDAHVMFIATMFALQEGAHLDKESVKATAPPIQRAVEDVQIASLAAPTSTNLTPMSTSSSPELSQDTAEPESHFLLLPAELRNNILRYTIVSQEKIKITADMARPPQEPAILRVNRQTRHEGLGIYYYENHFRFDMHNFDAWAYIAWVQARPTIRTQLQVWFKLYAVTLPDPAWDNLMAWLEALHRRKIMHGPSERAFPGKKRHRVVAGELKELAWSMRGQGLSWNSILANLAYSKRMLVASSATGRWI